MCHHPSARRKALPGLPLCIDIARVMHLKSFLAGTLAVNRSHVWKVSHFEVGSVPAVTHLNCDFKRRHGRARSQRHLHAERDPSTIAAIFLTVIAGSLNDLERRISDAMLRKSLFFG